MRNGPYRTATLGWSPSTAARMAKRCCHIGNVAKMNAVERLMVDCAVDESDASPKTVNLEVGTVCAILRRHRLWANLQPDVRMLATTDDHGKALTEVEEQALLKACADSRSLALLPTVVVALNTGMRYREVLGLQWRDVDLLARRVLVRHSKTQAGTGRVIPLNDHCLAVLEFLSGRFPDQRPDHYLFASERYWT